MQRTTPKQALQMSNHLSLVGVEVLVGLGLSGRQARVYLALLRVGCVGARGLAELALVERQEVYGLVEALRELGLVKVNLTVPASYTPTPIEAGIRLLLEQKTDELTVISKKAQELADRLNTQTPAASAVPLPCFGAICDGYRGKKYLNAIQETQHTIDATTSWTRFKQQSFRFENQFRASLKKDVALRFVVEKPLNHQLPKWVKATQERFDNFKVKIQPAPVAASVTIFDQTKAAIAFMPNANLSKGPDLWTTNPTLTTLCQTYFDTLWKQTKTNQQTLHTTEKVMG